MQLQRTVALAAVAWLSCSGGAATQSTAPSGTAASEPTIAIEPATALVDQPMSIRLAGLTPGETVTLRGTYAWLGVNWLSSAEFSVDPSGAVDLASQAPTSGSFAVADPMAVIWSAVPEIDDWQQKLRTDMRLDPITLRLELVRGADVIASADVTRLPVAPDVTRHDVRHDGLVGTLFLPPAAKVKRPLPAVLVLGGSDGGLREGGAALLASRGYAALALAYFAKDDLPANLVRIPLEYFETALIWMGQHEAIDKDKLAVMGTSRGGELVFLLGATYPQVKAVISYVPSNVVWAGISSGQRSESAWTYKGEPVPYVPGSRDPALGAEMYRKIQAGEPIEFTPWFRAGMKDQEAMARAAIAVENIQGPVLVISGKDDAVWPSTDLGELAIQRLRAHSHPHAYEHLAYDGAGHGILPPYRPTTISKMKHPAGMVILFGGTAVDNARACVESWQRVLSFLDKAFPRAGQ